MSDNAKIPLQVVVDSREQCPYRFEGMGAVVEVGVLASGDYSLHGFGSRIAIERKELGDLIGCLSYGRERFERELVRLRSYEFACVLVESPVHALRSGCYRSQTDPASAWQSILALQMRYRIPFIFCDDRSDAERTAFDILRHYARDRWRELQALKSAARMPVERTERRGPGVGMDRAVNDPQRRTGAKGAPCPTAISTGARI